LKGENMTVDEYDVMIESAKEDLRKAKDGLNVARQELSEAIRNLKEADQLVDAIQNTIAYYQELRENALIMGEDDEN
jgi:multidrug resistance efflux pump